MDHFYGQSSGEPSDTNVRLASSCPKKSAGRKKFKETRHPVYRGVRQRNGDRWVCEVRTPVDNSRIWLGTYPTAEMAARAHDVAALALRGQAACLNFADSAWRLPVPASSDTRDIQRAAAEAAATFCPPEESEAVTDQINNNNNNNNSVGTQYEDISVGGNYQMNNNYYNNEVTPATSSSTSGMYIDEEAMFNMPSLIDNMAQGLLLPPPRNASWGWEDTEGDCEVSLWNY